MYRQYTGCHSVHEHSNDNGSRLVQFATANNLVVGSTKFASRDIHLGAPGWKIFQPDHVLVSCRRQSSLLIVRTYWGANIDSDHYLVGLVIRCKIARSRAFGVGENMQPRLNMDPLRDNTFQKAFQLFRCVLRTSLIKQKSSIIICSFT